jgi:hypothetical protein
MPINKTCEQCGNTFQVKPNKADKVRFCDRTCWRAYEAVHGRTASYKDPIPFTCQFCGNTFTMKRGFVNAYRKKWNRDPMYCNMKCSDAGRRRASDERNKRPCLHCGAIFLKKRRFAADTIYREQKFCNLTCKGAYHTKMAAEKFMRGEYGRHVKRNGYVWISVPKGVTGKKGSVMEHRFVMSQHLGRELFAEETVHHINGDRSNNDLTNLELFSNRHGPGQRVADKVTFAIEILRLYPEFARKAGVELAQIPSP